MRAEPEPHERFDAAAAAYERARPPYPDELVAWIVATAGLAPGTAVLDVGAGTGDLTVRLIDAGLLPVAIEPSDRMRELLRVRLPAIEIHADRAERLESLEDGRFDLATAANSLHWLEPEPTLSELCRVLRPGGCLAIVWHLPDRRDRLQARLWALVEHLHAAAAPYPGPLPGEAPGWDGSFEPIGSERFTLVHRIDRALLPDYVASWSGVANLDPEARKELLEEVRGWSLDETIDLPFELEAVLGRRV